MYNSIKPILGFGTANSFPTRPVTHPLRRTLHQTSTSMTVSDHVISADGWREKQVPVFETSNRVYADIFEWPIKSLIRSRPKYSPQFNLQDTRWKFEVLVSDSNHLQSYRVSLILLSARDQLCGKFILGLADDSHILLKAQLPEIVFRIDHDMNWRCEWTFKGADLVLLRYSGMLRGLRVVCIMKLATPQYPQLSEVEEVNERVNAMQGPTIRALFDYFHFKQIDAEQKNLQMLSDLFLYNPNLVDVPRIAEILGCPIQLKELLNPLSTPKNLKRKILLDETDVPKKPATIGFRLSPFYEKIELIIPPRYLMPLINSEEDMWNHSIEIKLGISAFENLKAGYKMKLLICRASDTLSAMDVLFPFGFGLKINNSEVPLKENTQPDNPGIPIDISSFVTSRYSKMNIRYYSSLNLVLSF